MVSHETFKTLGFTYAVLGILGSIFKLFSAFSKNGNDPTMSHESNSYQNVGSSLVALVFFLILFGGIYQKNIIMVKIYKYFLIISGVLTELVFVYFLVVTIFAEEKSNTDSTIIIALSIGLALYTGLFLLFLWIVNGVIGYIENEKRSEGTGMDEVRPNDQKMAYTYEAVWVFAK